MKQPPVKAAWRGLQDQVEGAAVRGFRLGFWWRLGIVVTILWLVVGTSYFAITEIDKVHAAKDTARELCLRSAPAEFRACWDEWTQATHRFDSSIYWKGGLFITSILAGLFWLLYGIGFAAVKWVLAGRKQPQ